MASPNNFGSPTSDKDELLLRIKEEDERAMDKMEEQALQNNVKKLKGYKHVRTSIEHSDEAQSPETQKRTTSGEGILFDIPKNNPENQINEDKRKRREQIKVYAITYISYALIHFQREFWSLSKAYITKKHPEELSK